MKSSTRFMKSVTSTAQAQVTPVPWARGLWRASFIVKRSAEAQNSKTA